MVDEIKKQSEFITCLECGKDDLKQISHLHLKNCPGNCNNTQEYKLKYPDAPRLSDEYYVRKSKISKNLDFNCNPNRREERLARSIKGAKGRHINYARKHPRKYRKQIENFIKAGIPYRGGRHKKINNENS